MHSIRPVVACVILLASPLFLANDPYCSCEKRCALNEGTVSGSDCTGFTFSWTSLESYAGCCGNEVPDCEEVKPCYWTGQITVANNSGSSASVVIKGPGDPVTLAIGNGEEKSKWFLEGEEGAAPIVATCNDEVSSPTKVKIEIGSCVGAFGFNCGACPTSIPD